ncbi:MAG: DeoR/GlpR family DNA-binding transcription regulator [Erysipelotrichaceae bacterium]|nr:DeoR/GlpR family DNA-binding transcription regulator [Erysipelotrichaceae bacterium]
MKVSKDIVDKRRDEIMKAIQENNFISVDELVARFKVSAVTIRRDLQYWEDKGAIERNYGGASLIQEFVSDNSLYDRFRYMRAIAKRAALYVEDNDVIFINSSMTAVAVIDYIKNKNVTIITNNAKAINSHPDSNAVIMLTGGEVRYPKNSLMGELAVKTINSINANKCFIGCSGLTKNGISTGLMKETLVNKAMIDHTRGKRFVLCDHTKIGLDYNFNYSDFGGIDYLITDVLADNNTLEEIKEVSNLEVIKVEPLNK